jgi:endonuclease/exonuclease/phosphatase family metal-dependent hydrolase
MDRLHVATLNIRNIADRWDERLPLLLADMAALQPDLLGLQEVVYTLQQDRLIGSAGAAHYQAHRAWAGRPEYGNSLLVREPAEVKDVERLDIGLDRSVLLALVRLTAGAHVLIAVTHLHHVVPDEAERDDQARRLLDWLESAPMADAQVVVGDFNAEPEEPAYARMAAAGFTSAFAAANGAEPAATWPSGIQAPGMDTDGEPGCLDYIWVRGAITVTEARLVFDRPAVGDPTLYPSDHLGLSAHLEVGRGSAG